MAMEREEERRAGGGRTHLQQVRELEHGAPIAELIEAHLAAGLSMMETAARLRVAYKTLYRWAHHLRIRLPGNPGRPRRQPLQ